MSLGVPYEIWAYHSSPKSCNSTGPWRSQRRVLWVCSVGLEPWQPYRGPGLGYVTKVNIGYRVLSVWEVTFSQQHPFHLRPNGVTSPAFSSHLCIKTKECIYIGKPQTSVFPQYEGQLSQEKVHHSPFWATGPPTQVLLVVPRPSNSGQAGWKRALYYPQAHTGTSPDPWTVVHSAHFLQHRCCSLSSGCSSTQSSQHERETEAQHMQTAARRKQEAGTAQPTTGLKDSQWPEQEGPAQEGGLLPPQVGGQDLQ